jgi:SNF2 family DNA or RNA helicase
MDINDLQEQLKALASQMAEASELLAPINDAKVELNAAEYQLKQSYKEQMDAIILKKRELDNRAYDAQKTLNALQQKQQQIANAIEQKKIAQAKAKAEAEAEAAEREAMLNAALDKRFDLGTMRAPWREWAKDHQIAAGHKIAKDRYVILADDMGLGKTLSSIITSDMAEVATKEASPEFPFLGKEVEQYNPPMDVWTQKAVDTYTLGEWPWGNSAVANKIPAVDKPTGYIPFDLKNKLFAEEIIRRTEGEYVTKVVNAIERPVGRRVLYFCPAPLLRNVLDEWRNWAPHRNVTYIGNMSKAERNFVLDLTLPKLNEYVIIVNYEAWRRDKSLLEKLGECKFDTVIIDEAHNIKDMKSQAFKGVQTVINTCKPEYIIPMTGTPILNRPQELFSLLTLVNPDDFYSERDFLARYCEEYWPDGATNPKHKFKPGGLELLAKKIHTNFLRRTKKDAGIQLPEKVVIIHDLERDDENYPNQAKAREHMKKFATIVINEAKGQTLQATVMIALLTRLRQIETWPAGIKQIDKVTKETILQLDVEESQKLDYVIRYDQTSEEWEGLIPDTIESERMVVFSQFKAPLHELKRRIELMGKRAVILDGDTPTDLREQIRVDFDRNKCGEDYKWDVLLGNYRAAGVGLNMTAATSMVILDEEWNAGKRDQAYDRLHRIGQTENVTINVVRNKNTVDEWLADIISTKESLVNGFESAMSMADLKEAIDSGLI